MERISDKSTYELFGSSDISLGRLFWYRRFDNGMVAFLQCLSELSGHAEAQDKNFRLPHKIDRDKIGEMSIKIQFNNEETWTKALKYMLTDLKYLLVWMSKQNIATTPLPSPLPAAPVTLPPAKSGGPAGISPRPPKSSSDSTIGIHDGTGSDTDDSSSDSDISDKSNGKAKTSKSKYP
jgi:hypothetical protein